MATVDGFVPQHDVVGHLQAGNLKKEKFVDDYGLGAFGNEDCSFLAVTSELVDIPDFQSKLVLLKQKMKNKNNIKNSIHRIPLSIEINESIYIESSIDVNKRKKKRRRRRKKNKSMMIDKIKSGLDVEIINGVFISSTTPVLEMEHGTDISIPSSLLNNDSCSDNVSMISSTDGRYNFYLYKQQQQQYLKNPCIFDYMANKSSVGDGSEFNSGASSISTVSCGRSCDDYGGSNDSINNNNNSNLSFVASIGGRLVCDSDSSNDDNSAGQDCNSHLIQPADDLNKFGNLSDSVLSEFNEASGISNISNGSGIVDSNNKIVHSAVSCDDDDSTRHDLLYQPADSSGSYGNIMVRGGCDHSYCSDESQPIISNKKQFNPCNDLMKDIKTHTGVMFNGAETQFVPLILIAKDVNTYAKQFGDRIGIDRLSLQFLRLLRIDDINTGLCSELQMDFNFNGIGKFYPPEFYPLNRLFDDLLKKCCQYSYRIGCDRRSVKELKFLFIDNSSSLNSLNSNKNKNVNNNNNNNSTNKTNSTPRNNRNNRNNRNYKKNRHNDGGYATYGRRRGRKKRQYQMVYKNKLQNIKCKQFGNNDNYCNSYHNSVVYTNLVTARAPRCAPIK